MTEIWFTSDTHWGHANIIKYCNRPFENVTEMDEAMIENWNKVVNPGDTVYHLGDFAFAREVSTVENLLRRLKGQVHLILGNHDRRSVKKARGFADMTHYKEIKIDDQKIVLMHYAMTIWNRRHHGSWQLFGHSHGSLKRNYDSKQFDVGVDCWNFTPISYEKVKEEMAKHTCVSVDGHENLKDRKIREGIPEGE